MVGNVQFAVQQYQTEANGKSSRGLLTQCKSADEARHLAERCVSLGKSSGAAAFERLADNDFGEVDELITIASYGEVPADGRDVVAF